MTDLAELLRLAETATPGKWEHHTLMVSEAGQQIGRRRDICHCGIGMRDDSDEAVANAAYIAALSPDTAKKLIAVAMAAERADAAHRNYWYEASAIAHGSAHEKAIARIDAGRELRESFAALRVALEELKGKT